MVGMMSIFDYKNLSNNQAKGYIIAELGANHNGDMDLARKLIKKAKKAGADCVKFQSWTKNSVFAKIKYEDNYFLEDDYRNRTDTTLEDIVERYAISEAELSEMADFCKSEEIDFASTPFNIKEVDYLVDVLDAPFIKIASMDLNNYPFIEYVSKKNKPVMISTGFSELHEIDKAIKILEENNSQYLILHCVSTYPPVDTDINLNNIVTLKNCYPGIPVGFSDHSIGFEVPIAALAMGARIIEKHFTLDKDLEGWDHKVSATPEELEVICRANGRISNAKGTFRITANESDEKKSEFRRSIVTSKKLKEGHILEESDLDYKRPGTGILPEYRDLIIGRKLKNDLDNDVLIKLSDLL